MKIMLTSLLTLIFSLCCLCQLRLTALNKRNGYVMCYGFPLGQGSFIHSIIASLDKILYVAWKYRTGK